MNWLEIEVSAAEQLDIVHARIGRLVFQPFLFLPESFPAALLRELRYARTLLCSESRWERNASHPLSPSPAQSQSPSSPSLAPASTSSVIAVAVAGKKSAQLSLFGAAD
jgi:hypothetical protein